MDERDAARIEERMEPLEDAGEGELGESRLIQGSQYQGRMSLSQCGN
jgi:hypothetical protein